jgi:SAM-dependent methyltransferase
MSVDIAPLSEACERNKRPILEVLREALAAGRRVVEIGSGTGQHALHFSAHLPHLSWQPTDTAEYLPILRRRLQLERPSNLLDAVELDVRNQPWPVGRADAIFTANTLHIMDWGAVQDLFRGIGTVLGDPASRDAGHLGVLCIYGPFRYGGRYTSESNLAFDRFLQTRDPRSGIRDFDAVDALAQSQGLHLQADHAMPANNQLLVWQTGHTSCGAPAQ